MADDSQDRLNHARMLANEKIEHVSQSAKAAKAMASEKMAKARNKTNDAINTAGHIVSDHPMAAVAGAVAFGAMIAMVMPSLWRRKKTRNEQDDEDSTS